MGSMFHCSVIMLALTAFLLVGQCTTVSSINTDNEGGISQRNLKVLGMQPRSACIESGNCDHNPMSCCEPKLCRCNLWGANCRCARRGIF